MAEPTRRADSARPRPAVGPTETNEAPASRDVTAQAATSDASSQDVATTGSGTLLARLAAMSLLPTTLTAIGVACCLLLLGDAGPVVSSTPLVAACGVLALALALQLAWVVRTTRGVLAPVERLVRAVDDADGAALESLHRRPDWEIALLYRRVRDLLVGRARANEEYQALLHAHRQVEAAAGVLDRVATGDSPGDAGGFSGFLAPIGTSLRALIERLDRRDGAVRSRIVAIRREVTDLSGEVRDVGGHFEHAFMGLIEVVAGMKDARHAITATERELERAGLERPREMLAKLGGRVEANLGAIGRVSSDLEQAASTARRLVARGERLSQATERLVPVRAPAGSPEIGSDGLREGAPGAAPSRGS